jgi:hypothetical protein
MRAPRKARERGDGVGQRVVANSFSGRTRVFPSSANFIVVEVGNIRRDWGEGLRAKPAILVERYRAAPRPRKSEVLFADGAGANRYTQPNRPAAPSVYGVTATAAAAAGSET